MTFRSELLPAPLGPMIARISPRRASRLTPESAATPPNESETSSTERRTSPIFPLRSMSVGNALDRSPEPAQLLFHPLVTTVKMVDALDDGLSVGRESRQGERGRGAQVARHHPGTGQTGRAVDEHAPALEPDARPHALELGGVLKTILEDRLGDRRDPVHH